MAEYRMASLARLTFPSAIWPAQGAEKQLANLRSPSCEMHHHVLHFERDVADEGDGRLIASGTEPWLSLDGFDRCWRDRFVEIVYRSSWLDEPARPIFRFWQEDGSHVDRIGTAATVAGGIWVGRVPPATVSLSVSPTNKRGRFDFRIERISLRPWRTLVAAALARRPSFAWRALALRTIGCRAESDVMLDWGLSATDIGDFATWHRRRYRPFDQAGLDRPRCDWSRENVILVVCPTGEAGDWPRTMASLRSQIFENWSAILLHGTVDDGCASDPRVQSASMQALSDRSKDWADDTLVGVLATGVRLVTEALAYVVEQARRHPDIHVFYGDMLVTGDDGVEMPVFLRAWSPRPPDPNDLSGCPVFVRASALRATNTYDTFFSEGRLPDAVLASGAKALRRILATSARTSPVPPRLGGDRTDRIDFDHSRDATATIVIPTCDNPAMLERLLASIMATSTRSLAEVVIVDNGARSEGLGDVVARHGSKANVKVIDFKEPFNFSTICNLGASLSQGDVLVFLNDDMEILSEDWLARLVAHATAPDVGAVGAKLTYPDGRLQHVGMVVGMGESAGHFGARESGNSPGWLGRNTFVHEISAVTGACLAVERRKFDDVGRFDSHHYPVELGDVDLCLRLRERGWHTLLDPHVHIMHLESKSRGRATFRRLAVHAAERKHFRDRWRHVLRDDPCFHPGLSLYDWRPALG